jgi:D-ribose pyranase
MKSHGVIHPGLARALAELGHTDQVLICDAGFPIPHGVKRIDLAYRLGAPKFADVVEAIVSDIVVESTVIADETTSELTEWLMATTKAETNMQIPHEALKERARGVKIAVRSGETTRYSNVILVAGVAF